MKEELKQVVIDYITNCIKEYPKKTGLPNVWREPVVGFGDAKDEYFKNLKVVVNDRHKDPQFFMEDATIIISYFIPFKKKLADTNIDVEGNFASKEWSDGYTNTNNMFKEINEGLANLLISMGYKAIVPYDIGMYKDILMSSWSQKHIAVGSGVGTFGINNLVITERGSCGRISSIVTNLPVVPTPRIEKERCLYKQDKSCMACVKRCFAGVLTPDMYDRFECRKMNQRTETLYGEECCGKCDTGLPCSHEIPKKKED